MRVPLDWLAPLPASTPAVGLPRAGALTDALLSGIAKTGTATAGSTPAANASEEAFAAAVAAARSCLEHGLAAVAADAEREPDALGALRPRPRPPILRIGHYQIARALEGQLPPIPGAGGGATFRWTAHTARRSIGLAALRVGLDGRAPTPADAVAAVMAEPDGPFGIGRSGPGSCADWIASLSAPARTLVAADATAWTTRLWTAIDWGRLAPRRLVVGRADRWWRWTDPSATWRVAVRGRADVRIGAASGRDGGIRGAHLVVLDGQPEPGSRHALLLSALVDALSSRRHPQPTPGPSHVIGWWPDCGKSWIVPVDARTLVVAAEAVVSTTRAMLGNEMPRVGEEILGGSWAGSH